MAFNFTTQKDVVKQLQYIAEGTTAATFGVIPTNPAFVMAGINPTILAVKKPVPYETRELGYLTRQNVQSVFNSGEVTFKTNILDSTMLKWLFNAPAGAGTIDESKTFVYSYNVNGTETFRVMKGCKPLDAHLMIKPKGQLELTAHLYVANMVDETQSANGGITLGTGAFASQLGPTGGWLHSDGGAGPFTYNSTVYRDFGMTLGVKWIHEYLDSSGDLQTLYMKPSKKELTFDIDIAKYDMLVNIDAAALSRRSASRVLKTATSTMTLTNVNFTDPTTSLDQTSTKILVEALKGIADEVAIT
jgi:hypothetical protein